MRLFLFLALISLIHSGCSSRDFFQDTRILMGTLVKISCISGKDQTCRENINKAFQEIRRIEELLSNFKPESDISRLNRSKGELIPVSDETLEVIKKAQIFYSESGGAFDITVSPILKIWGFYDRDNPVTAVPADQIQRALGLVGSDKIIIDEDQAKIGFKIPGMAIDLGGIAKGYAADQAKKILSQAGIKNGMVAVAGDIYCLGGGRDNKGWRIGIRHPLKKDEIIATLKLENKAISTSGQYENFIQIGNSRFSHIINPRTGYPVENDLLSVTVVADEAIVSDALATAVFVLGPEEGQKLLDKFKAEGVLISQSEKGLRFLVTEGLKQNLRINY